MEIKKHQLEPRPREVKAQSPQDEIYLSIKIGNGQIGGNKVSLDGTVIAKGNLTGPTFIGISKNLEGAEIEIETNVLDVNSFTNNCVITTTFHNQKNKVLFAKIDKGDSPDNGVASFNGKYIFKILSVLFFLFYTFDQNINAQNTSDKVELKGLETPSSPGFILLDQTPASIERPTTPQGLGLSLLGFQQNGGALEFAPFWLTTHPDLAAETMYKNKIPLLTHFSVSLAAVKSDTASYLAGGIRSRLFQSFGNRIITKLDSLKRVIENELSKSPDDIDLNKIEKLRKDYVNITEKPVFNIDFAAAIGGGSNSNSFNDLAFSRWAAWLSLNLRPKGDDFYITTLARYINNEKYEEYIFNADLVDIGARLNYDISKFSISIEYLQRMNFTSKIYDNFRIAAIGSYKINENMYLTTTFGKNFSDVNNIIALAGVNFGFSNSKIKAYQ